MSVEAIFNIESLHGRQDAVLHLSSLEDEPTAKHKVAVWIDQHGKQATCHLPLHELEAAIAAYRELHRLPR